MKKAVSTLLIAIVFLLTSGRAQEPQATDFPFTMTISGPAQVAPGTPIKIALRLTNTSDRDISVDAFYFEGLDTFFTYDVRNRDGKSVPKRKRAEGGSLRARTLKPGESVEEGILISREFNMNRPGQYTIQLSRTVPEDTTDRIVSSNKLVLTVTP